MLLAEKFGSANAGSKGLWLSEIKASLMLGLPIVGAQLAQMAINTTDVIMIGWLGAEELAAAVLAFNLYILFWLFGLGLLQAVIPLAARARGQRNPRELRRVVRMGFWVVVAYSAPCMIVLWHTQDILLFLGQDAGVSALSGQYMQVMMWAFLPSQATMAVRGFVTVMGKAQVVLWTTVAGAILNAVFDYVLIFGAFGAPRLEMVGAGIASVATATLTFLMILAYVLFQRQLRRYSIFGRIWRSDWPAFWQILRLGWPIGATLLYEVGLFSAASVLVGWLGTVQLAAHGIALQLSSIAFMIPLGLGQAGMIRVGLAAGANDHAGVGRAGWTAMGVSLVTMIAAALVFWLFPETLMSLFLNSENPESQAIFAFGASYLAIAALFQVFDGAQVVGANILRGLSDTHMPMIFAFVGYWIIGFSLAYTLGFPAGLGGVGVWLGLASGLAFVSVLLVWRFALREKLRLVERSA